MKSQSLLVIIREGAILEIKGIKGGLGITAVIKNTGSVKATNVTWFINVQNALKRETKGDIPTILSGEEKIIKSVFIFGFAFTPVEIMVFCDEGSSSKFTINGIIILFFILLPT